MAVLGCIADDFTGASDAASFLVKGGMSVKLYNGVPDKAGSVTETAQAIVIALKSRSQEPSAAVADNLAAAKFLLSQGVKQIYFKYCSTFDCTPKGNIGPVADALMDLLGVPYTLLCPSLPVNGRTVENGVLYVNGVPLDESPMKNHPLNPMWDSHLDRLMEPQSRYGCVVVGKGEPLPDDPAAGREEPFYLIPDYVTDEDGEKIVEKYGSLALLTGGSGLLEPLARQWVSRLSAKGEIPNSATKGKALLIAGSCSKMTLSQIDTYQAHGFPSCKLEPARLLDGTQTLDEVWDFVKANTTEDVTVLAYSSEPPEKLKETQALGAERVSALLENAAAWLAKKAMEEGYTRIISAGGETSGAVTQGLGFSSFWMGESVAPGVPVMIPAERTDMRIVLKSGNFGQEDFFDKALTMTHKAGPEDT